MNIPQNLVFLCLLGLGSVSESAMAPVSGFSTRAFCQVVGHRELVSFLSTSPGQQTNFKLKSLFYSTIEDLFPLYSDGAEADILILSEELGKRDLSRWTLKIAAAGIKDTPLSLTKWPASAAQAVATAKTMEKLALDRPWMAVSGSRTFFVAPSVTGQNFGLFETTSGTLVKELPVRATEWAAPRLSFFADWVVFTGLGPNQKLGWLLVNVDTGRVVTSQQSQRTHLVSPIFLDNRYMVWMDWSESGSDIWIRDLILGTEKIHTTLNVGTRPGLSLGPGSPASLVVIQERATLVNPQDPAKRLLEDGSFYIFGNLDAAEGLIGTTWTQIPFPATVLGRSFSSAPYTLERAEWSSWSGELLFDFGPLGEIWKMSSDTGYQLTSLYVSTPGTRCSHLSSVPEYTGGGFQ